VAGYAISYRHIRFLRTGVSFSIRSLIGHVIRPTISTYKVLLTMGLQRETAGRASLAIYTSVCPPCSHYLRRNVYLLIFLRQIVFAVIFDHTFNSLDHRGIGDRELGYLYHCNLPSISSGYRSHAHARTVDKAEDYHQASEWCRLGTASG
jgi:hypothetical protein